MHDLDEETQNQRAEVNLTSAGDTSYCLALTLCLPPIPPSMDKGQPMASSELAWWSLIAEVSLARVTCRIL